MSRKEAALKMSFASLEQRSFVVTNPSTSWGSARCPLAYRETKSQQSFLGLHRGFLLAGCTQKGTVVSNLLKKVSQASAQRNLRVSRLS